MGSKREEIWGGSAMGERGKGENERVGWRRIVDVGCLFIKKLIYNILTNIL